MTPAEQHERRTETEREIEFQISHASLFVQRFVRLRSRAMSRQNLKLIFAWRCGNFGWLVVCEPSTITLGSGRFPNQIAKKKSPKQKSVSFSYSALYAWAVNMMDFAVRRVFCVVVVFLSISLSLLLNCWSIQVSVDFGHDRTWTLEIPTTCELRAFEPLFFLFI